MDPAVFLAVAEHHSVRREIRFSWRSEWLDRDWSATVSADNLDLGSLERPADIFLAFLNDVPGRFIERLHLSGLDCREANHCLQIAHRRLNQEWVAFVTGQRPRPEPESVGQAIERRQVHERAQRLARLYYSFALPSPWSSLALGIAEVNAERLAMREREINDRLAIHDHLANLDATVRPATGRGIMIRQRWSWNAPWVGNTDAIQFPEERAGQVANDRAQRFEQFAESFLAPPRRQVANDRALSTLKRCLSPEQLDTFERENWFNVRTPQGTIYQIWAHRVFNVVGESVAGHRLMYCAQPAEELPLCDQLLTQKLLLEHDPQSFFRVANVQPAPERMMITNRRVEHVDVARSDDDAHLAGPTVLFPSVLPF